MAAQVDDDKCIGCGLCVDACPIAAITMEDDKAVIAENKCTECGECVTVCPNGAINIG